jgi:hypothetical protein
LHDIPRLMIESPTMAFSLSLSAEASDSAIRSVLLLLT